MCQPPCSEGSAASTTDAVSPGGPSLRQLAGDSLYIGLTGYGGPAILGHVKQVFVVRRKWVTEQEFLTGLSLAQLLPGATTVQAMEFLGYQLNGFWGAVVAPACFLTPSVLLMSALSAIYFAHGHVPLAVALFTGLGSVVIALLANATVTLARSAIKDVRGALLAVGTLIAVLWLHLHILLVVVVSAGVGWVLYGRPGTERAEPAALARGSGWQTSLSCWHALGLLGLALFGVLCLMLRPLEARVFLSMFRVGALAFGGGFTVVPLLQQEAVTGHHWLTVREFLDGIALGQVTPGPVLVTATFIGFRAAGLGGALVASVAIFAPSWLGMYVMARQHERIRHLGWVRAMISGVVAGFIGVLVSVTIQLARHSLTDWRTVALAAAGVLILLAGRKDPLWVILGGAAVSPFLFA